MNNTYLLIEWPDVQELMDEPWFTNEAVLAEGETVGSSAYFIPENRIINDLYILNRCEDLALQLKSTDSEEEYIYEEWNTGMPFDGGMNTFESILNLKLSLNGTQSES